MKFNDLTLSGWSFERGDKRVEISSLGLPEFVKSRNPVNSTWVYSDESEWENRLVKQVILAQQKAKIDPDKLSVFLGIHNGYKSHPEGASPVVMSAFPSAEGFGFDFSLGCASVIVAAKLAGLHFSQNDIDHVAVGAVQMTTQYTDNCSDGNCIFADSIGAFMFSKNTDGNLIRYVKVNTNPEFRDMFILGDDAKYHLANLHKGKELSKYMVKTFGTHLRESCLAMKTYPKDIDFIAISCSNYASSKMVLDQMNFPIEKSGISCLKEVPHMGTNDLLYQLDYGLETGLIQPGSKVIVSGTSLGFSMGTMAIEWGKED